MWPFSNNNESEPDTQQGTLDEQKAWEDRALREGTPGYDPANPDLTPDQIADKLEEERRGGTQ